MAKILVVDDEATNTVILSRLLTTAGYEVRTALSGTEGLAAGVEFKLDIIISDWKLNDTIDGCELSRKLKSADQKLKVILFTGCPLAELKEEAKDIETVAIMEKPFDLITTLRKVENALGK